MMRMAFSDERYLVMRMVCDDENGFSDERYLMMRMVCDDYNGI
jgi:hypothetical protein